MKMQDVQQTGHLIDSLNTRRNDLDGNWRETDDSTTQTYTWR